MKQCLHSSAEEKTFDFAPTVSEEKEKAFLPLLWDKITLCNDEFLRLITDQKPCTCTFQKSQEKISTRWICPFTYHISLDWRLFGLITKGASGLEAWSLVCLFLKHTMVSLSKRKQKEISKFITSGFARKRIFFCGFILHSVPPQRGDSEKRSHRDIFYSPRQSFINGDLISLVFYG